MIELRILIFLVFESDRKLFFWFSIIFLLLYIDEINFLVSFSLHFFLSLYFWFDISEGPLVAHFFLTIFR